MDLNPTTLFIKDAKGALRQWSIAVEDYIIVIKHGQLGGVQQVTTEEVEEGKAGRTLEEQIELRVSSRINKQKDKGYTEDIQFAERNTVNALGLKKPMLAQPLKNIKNIDFDNAFIQHKYDGNRCLIANIGGKKIAYTRNSKVYATIDHILDSISIPANTILDGELYCHGQSLQTIISWCKRDKPIPESKRLRYHCYDIISPKPFTERLNDLYEIDFGEHGELVPTVKVTSLDTVFAFLKASLEAKYEGTILRWGNFGYEDGKRSKSLIKIKEWKDDVFVVVGINPSKDYWAILTCILPKGASFSISAPGTIEEKREVLINKQNYLGRSVRVEYQNLTKDGVPFHPVATNWVD